MQLRSTRENSGKLVLLSLFVLIAIVGCRSETAGVATTPLPPSEVRFTSGTSAEGIPFRVIDNNMYLTIRINDSVEVEAAFDSGFPLNGVLIIDSALGDRLGLQYVGSTPLAGAGDESSIADVAIGATVSLPGVSFHGQQVLVVRNTQRYEAWLADGIVGGTILNSCVVQIDHEKSVLNIYGSGSFDPAAAGEVFDVTFSQGIPVVTAAVETGNGARSRVRLLVDTGADVPFSFHSSNGSGLQPPQGAPKSFIAEGITGEIFGRWSRMNAIHLGPFTMTDCIVVYPTEGFEDVVVTLGQNGFFGLEAQRRFTLTFDYRRQRMYLKQNSLYGVPFEFNMAGLLLRTLPDGHREVMDVLPDSPGHLAGIKKGDRIAAINDRPIGTISSSESERLFTLEGRSLLLSIERDGSIVDAKVTLRRLI